MNYFFSLFVKDNGQEMKTISGFQSLEIVGDRLKIEVTITTIFTCGAEYREHRFCLDLSESQDNTGIQRVDSFNQLQQLGGTLSITV